MIRATFKLLRFHPNYILFGGAGFFIGYQFHQKLHCSHNYLFTPRKATSSSFIADAAEKVLESVVNISVDNDPASLFSSSYRINGSGFFIDDQGTILTNAHVVSDMTDDSSIVVTTSQGEQLEAYVHALDAPADLAVIKLCNPKGNYKSVVFGSYDNIRVGDWAIAIGCPFGLQNTVTAGVISSLSRKSSEIGGTDNRVDYIQTDCVVHRYLSMSCSGNSGGPLCNDQGQVIGINSSRAEGDGISFAIRTDTTMGMIQQLVRHGRVARPFLGINTTTLEPGIWKQLNESGQNMIPPIQRGVLVTKVFPKSPASRSELQVGDVIVGVNSFMINSTQELLKRIGLTIGKPIDLAIKRSLAIDIDWDGRVNRYEIIEKNVKIIPAELDMFINASKEL